MKNTTVLGELWKRTQERMSLDLGESRAQINASSSGESSELNWAKWLHIYLPKRYTIDRDVTVVDSNQNVSDQIDILIYDRQYTPALREHNNKVWVPAESVYAVFEAKPNLNKERLEYAAEKICSVRKLARTSIDIHHAGGRFGAKKPSQIIGGILCDRCDWSMPLAEPTMNILKSLPNQQQVDIGFAAKHVGFSVSYQDNAVEIKQSLGDHALAFFLTELVKRLQLMGTVPSIDYSKYAKFMTISTSTSIVSENVDYHDSKGAVCTNS